jgi:PhzF family phenazine biosynthesis protein
MSLPFELIDAFVTDAPFSGNPAGVVLLSVERPEAWMQSVAMEVNHAETAFVRAIEGGFSIRWFTPTVEVALCGHATLAAAAFLKQNGHWDGLVPVHFVTKDGLDLYVSAIEDSLELDFPAEPVSPAHHIALDVLFEDPKVIGANRMDWLVAVESEEIVRKFVPDYELLRTVGMRGVILTAPGSGESEVVSRFFAPNAGVEEDHVTGSAHCAIGPYWASLLGKQTLRCEQASPRGGFLDVTVGTARVRLRGKTRTMIKGELLG